MFVDFSGSMTSDSEVENVVELPGITFECTLLGLIGITSCLVSRLHPDYALFFTDSLFQCNCYINDCIAKSEYFAQNCTI